MSDFSVTFLGTGSALPDGERAQAGLLIEGPTTILLDCGSGVLSNLARTEVGIEGVDTVLLTHHHLDHLSDLMVLCKARWLAGTESLQVVGPAGTESLVEGLFSVHDYLDEYVDVSVREVSPGAFEVGGFEVSAIETRHSMDCLAYRFESAERTGATGGATDSDPASTPETDSEEPPAFTFSADSEPFVALAEFADGSTLAHDCSFPDEVDVSNHPTPTGLGETLAEADAEFAGVYLTHLYPHTRGRHDAMLESIADHYAGDVRFARDGLTIEIG
jgi:ribonuclease BN (tRNA processing enzyme)